MHTTSLTHSPFLPFHFPPPLFPSSSTSNRQVGWLADTGTRSNPSTSTAAQEKVLLQGQQTAMSDNASSEEVVRRVEAKLKIAREKGEFGKKLGTERSILSIARNTCGEELK